MVLASSSPPPSRVLVHRRRLRSATWWQANRALGGNGLSWFYTFEWPIFAGIAVAAWWHLIHEDPEDRPRGREREERSIPPSARPNGGPPVGQLELDGAGDRRGAQGIPRWRAEVLSTQGDARVGTPAGADRRALQPDGFSSGWPRSPPRASSASWYSSSSVAPPARPSGRSALEAPPPVVLKPGTLAPGLLPAQSSRWWSGVVVVLPGKAGDRQFLRLMVPGLSGRARGGGDDRPCTAGRVTVIGVDSNETSTRPQRGCSPPPPPVPRGRGRPGQGGDPVSGSGPPGQLLP